MTNEVSLFGNTDVAIPKRESALSQVFKPQDDAPKQKGNRITTNNKGYFKKTVAGQEVGDPVRDELEVVIINALPKVSREYYSTEYEEGNTRLPDCWSNLGDKPEAGCESPQASSCAMCPQNVKGSGGGERRACKFQRRLAVMVPGDNNVYQWKIPAGSLFGKGTGNSHPLEAYFKFLANNGHSPDTIVTKVYHNPNAKGETYELLFQPVRPLNDNEYAAIVKAQGTEEAKNYVEMTVAQNDGAAEIPFEQPKAIEAAEPEAAEPKKRASKKSEPAPEPAAALSAIVDAWGADDA